jgi:hypothetical protein
VHFSEHELATLAKQCTQRAVGDMKFGDRRTCDHMVERIRERIEELNQEKKLADFVKRRTDTLVIEAKYHHETDTVPAGASVATIKRVLAAPTDNPMRRMDDAPLHVNVLDDDYWDLHAVLR